MQTYTGTTEVQPASERNLFEKTWFTPSEADLAKGTPLREAVEETLASWHPNYASDSGRISDYEDWLERLEGGVEIPGHPHWYLSIGTDTTEAPYTTLKKIAQAVAKDLR